MGNGTWQGIRADTSSLIQLRMQARTLNLELSRLSRSVLSGQNSSHFRGRGMDYSESRHYQPGDDVRAIDWRVTARTGKTHTKVYIEERERPVFIVAHFSQSLYFGTRESFKSVLAARAAALISWTAVLGGDRLGGILVVDNRPINLKPESGRRGALAMIRNLSGATAAVPQADEAGILNRALEHLNTAVHPGSLVFLFGDFYQCDSTTERLLSLICQHNNMALFNLLDPVEVSVPPPGRYAISDFDGQQGPRIINTGHRAIRDRYGEICRLRSDRLKRLSRSCRVPVIDLVTGNDLVRTLSSTFGRHGPRPL